MNDEEIRKALLEMEELGRIAREERERKDAEQLQEETAEPVTNCNALNPAEDDDDATERRIHEEAESIAREYAAYIDGMLSRNTVKRYYLDARLFLEHIGCDMARFDEPNVRVYSGLFQNVNKPVKQVSAKTRNLRIIALRNFADYLVKTGRLQSNPLTDVKPYKTEKKVPESLTDEQINRLLEGETGETKISVRNRALLEFLYCTGCRQDEARNVKISDVNFRERTAILTGKGSKQRMVVIGEEAMEWVKRYLHDVRRLKEEKLEGDAKTRQSALFESTFHHKAMRQQDIWRVVNSAGKRIGLDNVHPHMLRHTFATQMLRNGANIRVIQEFLGHESLATTQVYLTVDDADKKNAFEQFFPKRH